MVGAAEAEAEAEAEAARAVADEVAEDSAIAVDASKKRVGNNITSVVEDGDQRSRVGMERFYSGRRNAV